MSSSPTVHVLIVYSHAESRLVESKEFYDAVKATAAYAEKERELMRADTSGSFEIVLIGSDSIGTIMKTHGHYFANDTEFFPMTLGSATV